MEGLMSREEPGFSKLESWLYLQMPNNAIVSEITSEQNQIQGIARVFSPLNWRQDHSHRDSLRYPWEKLEAEAGS